MRTACIMFLFALLLQGCGKKGPLYLPKPQPGPTAAQAGVQPQAASQPDAAQPAPAR